MSRSDTFHAQAADGRDHADQHLYLIDPDDQIVYEGPSSGMPLFARLGLLRTVEISESEQSVAAFSSHSSGALGIVSPISTSDCLDLCLQRCPRELMFSLVALHVHAPVFFPLLHAPSFLAEFAAVTQRSLRCTPQYGAFLMSVLACTARLVTAASGLLLPADRERAISSYADLALDLLRLSPNKLDIRYILALYCQKGSTGSHASYLAEAVGLAFATGLHRSTSNFAMDPVTHQLRVRLFWAIHALDTALAYSHGRPALIRLSECSVELPTVVDNKYITKNRILAQPDDEPAIAMAATVKVIETSIVLEQVLSAINAPVNSAPPYHLLESYTPPGADRRAMANERLDQSVPACLQQAVCIAGADAKVNLVFFHKSRVQCAVQFVRTLILRQDMVEEIDRATTGRPVSQATREAARLSVGTVKSYSKLRHLGVMQYCGFGAVAHLTAAAHTLIACMLRDSELAFEHRPDLLVAIDMLSLFTSRFPCTEAIAQLLFQLSRSLDGRAGAIVPSANEAVAIRVLARKMAPSPFFTPLPATTVGQSASVEPSVRYSDPPSESQSSLDAPVGRHQPPAILAQMIGALEASASASSEAVRPSYAADFDLTAMSASAVPSLTEPWPLAELEHLGDNFSFLNDGLFANL